MNNQCKQIKELCNEAMKQVVRQCSLQAVHTRDYMGWESGIARSAVMTAVGVAEQDWKALRWRYSSHQ